MIKKTENKTMLTFIYFACSTLFLALVLISFQYIEKKSVDDTKIHKISTNQSNTVESLFRYSIRVSNRYKNHKEISENELINLKTEVTSIFIPINENHKNLMLKNSDHLLSFYKLNKLVVDFKNNETVFSVLHSLIKMSHESENYLKKVYDINNKSTLNLASLSVFRSLNEGALILASLTCLACLINLVLHVFNESKSSKVKQNYLANILLVDDEEEVLSILEINSDKNFRFFRAKDGIDALDMISQNEIDMVISDVSMPRMNGLELANKLQLNNELEVVLMTSFNDLWDNDEYNSEEESKFKGQIYNKFDIITDVDNIIHERLDLGVMA